MTQTQNQTNVDQLIENLNSYAGDNVWQDLILADAGYDEIATDAVDTGRSDSFVAYGQVIRWDQSTNEWYHGGAAE